MKDIQYYHDKEDRATCKYCDSLMLYEAERYFCTKCVFCTNKTTKTDSYDPFEKLKTEKHLKKRNKVTKMSNDEDKRPFEQILIDHYKFTKEALNNLHTRLGLVEKAILELNERVNSHENNEFAHKE